MNNLFGISLMLFFSLLSFSLSAQDNEPIEKTSEIKVNAFYFIIGAVELQYEKIINEESSFGVSATYIFEEFSDWKWGITPHYRLFFGKKNALGFFVEGNGTLLQLEGEFWEFNSTTGTSMLVEEDQIAAGLGLAVGGKFKTSRDVVVEVYAGLGRIFGESRIGAYPRAGISIGKRF